MFLVCFIVIIVVLSIILFLHNRITRNGGYHFFSTHDSKVPQATIDKTQIRERKPLAHTFNVFKKRSEEKQLIEAISCFYMLETDENVLKTFIEFSEQGYNEATYMLGMLYLEEESDVVDYNPKQAQAYFLQAAERGYAVAQYKWAEQIIIEQATQDLNPNEKEAAYNKARLFMQQAAEQKIKNACLWLAKQYLLESYDFVVDYPKVCELLETVIQQQKVLGYPAKLREIIPYLSKADEQEAYYLLGVYYASEIDTATDYEKSAYYLEEVNKIIPEPAAFFALARLYDSRKISTATKSAEEVAFNYYKQAYDLIETFFDRFILKFEQQQFSQYEKPLPANYSTAELKALAKENHLHAQYQLALNGQESEALYWMRSVAEQMMELYISESLWGNYKIDSLLYNLSIPTIHTCKPSITPHIVNASSLEQHYITLINSADCEEVKKAKVCLEKLIAEHDPEAYFYVAAEHYSKFQYELAFSALEKARKQASIHCFYLLGELYLSGYAVEKNKLKAEQYFKQGALLGCCYAQYHLGCFSYTRSAWLELAAKQNHQGAIAHVAENYSKGKNGYALDYTRAYETYQCLAESKKTTLSLLDYKEPSDGLVSLGFMHLKGEGKKKDFSTAVTYFERALEGCTIYLKTTQYTLANIYYGGFLEIPTHEALAKAASLYRSVCHCLLTEEPLSKMPTRELEALAKQGAPSFQYQMGLRCQDYTQFAYNKKQAIYWFSQAAKKQYAPAIYELASHYLTIEENAVKACDLLKPLADDLMAKEYKIYQYAHIMTVDALEKLQCS